MSPLATAVCFCKMKKAVLCHPFTCSFEHVCDVMTHKIKEQSLHVVLQGFFQHSWCLVPSANVALGPLLQLTLLLFFPTALLLVAQMLPTCLFLKKLQTPLACLHLQRTSKWAFWGQTTYQVQFWFHLSKPE